MQPPVAGIFSPSIQVRLVVASNIGFSTGTARLNAQPRFCWSGRTGRTVTMVPPVVVLERFLRRPGTIAGVRVRLLVRGPRTDRTTVLRTAPDRIAPMTSSYVVLLP